MGSRACAANRSTTVKKAIVAMTMKRTAPSRTVCGWGSAVIAAPMLSDMRCSFPLDARSEPGTAGRREEAAAEDFPAPTRAGSHAVLVGILRDVRGDQNDRLLARVLPPV